jgi:uncharacterized peroxidase-related enzyme
MMARHTVDRREERPIMPYFPFLERGDGISVVYRFEPDLWDPFVAFTKRLMRGPGDLGVPERELVATYTSALNACRYCAGAHGATAAVLGYPAEVLDALVEDLETAPVDDRLRALLRLVRLVTLTPNRIGPEDVAAPQAAGWSEAAVRHAVAISARYGMVNRLSMAHGIEVDPEELERVGKRMAEWPLDDA